MYNPSRADARRFFFDAWSHYRAGESLSTLEQAAVELIAAHPEYHGILADPDRYADRDYPPEAGQVNPFLHLSLHLAVAEQLSIDQPRGILAEFRRLAASRDEHDAQHAVIECLGEIVWQAQRARTAPDGALYLDCLRRR